MSNKIAEYTVIIKGEGTPEFHVSYMEKDEDFLLNKNFLNGAITLKINGPLSVRKISDRAQILKDITLRAEALNFKCDKIVEETTQTISNVELVRNYVSMWEVTAEFSPENGPCNADLSLKLSFDDIFGETILELVNQMVAWRMSVVANSLRMRFDGLIQRCEL